MLFVAIFFFTHMLIEKGIAMDRVSSIMNASRAYERGYFGEKVGVAILDTGIYLHPDLESRVACFMDCINGRSKPYDDNGHGTHVEDWKHDNFVYGLDVVVDRAQTGSCTSVRYSSSSKVS